MFRCLKRSSVVGLLGVAVAWVGSCFGGGGGLCGFQCVAVTGCVFMLWGVQDSWAIRWCSSV